MRVPILAIIIASLLYLVIIMALYRLMHEGFWRKFLLAGISALFGGFMKAAFDDFLQERRQKKAAKKAK